MQPVKEPYSYTTQAGRAVQVLGWINLAILGFAAVVFTARSLLTAEPLPDYAFGAFLIGIVLSAAYVYVGAEMKKHKKWAVVLGWAIGILSLFNFPIGTVLGAVVLIYLYKGRNERAAEVQGTRDRLFSDR